MRLCTFQLELIIVDCDLNVTTEFRYENESLLIGSLYFYIDLTHDLVHANIAAIRMIYESQMDINTIL